MIFSNIRSLRKNVDYFEAFLEKNKYDLMGITETWMKKDGHVFKNNYYKRYFELFQQNR